MRLMFLNAVVERIAKYPFRGAVCRGLRPCRKGFVQVKNVCYITWGYVASTHIGGRGRVEFSAAWGAPGRRAWHAEQFYKNGRKALGSAVSWLGAHS